VACHLPCSQSPFLYCVCLMKLQHWEFSSLPHLFLQGRFSIPHPSTPTAVSNRLQFAVYVFQFC
jgi:hypothetical protein